MKIQSKKHEVRALILILLHNFNLLIIKRKSFMSSVPFPFVTFRNLGTSISEKEMTLLINYTKDIKIVDL